MCAFSSRKTEDGVPYVMRNDGSGGYWEYDPPSSHSSDDSSEVRRLQGLVKKLQTENNHLKKVLFAQSGLIPEVLPKSKTAKESRIELKTVKESRRDYEEKRRAGYFEKHR